MTNSNVRDHPGRIVAEAVGAHIDNMRNWTRNGFLDGFGERGGVGGAWYYTRGEALAIALAVALARAGLGFSAAFEVVKHPTPDVVAALDGQDAIKLRFCPAQNAGAMSSAVNIVVDASAIVKEASKRLDSALEIERRRPRRRLAFERAPISSFA